MTDSHRNQDLQEHRNVAALLPWYVNDTLDEGARQRVDSHLQRCADCRDDLAREQRVFQGMNAQAAVEHMPAASLKRLHARLDALSATAAPPETQIAAGPSAESGGSVMRDAPGAAHGRPVPAAAGRNAATWRGLMAASVAVMAVALSVLAADRWMEFHARSAAADYYTVTTPTPRAPQVVIRAVFAPSITLVELQSLLDEAQLRIVSGPTEAGVYSLAANSRRPVNSSLALLRAHAKVRFAESTQPGTEQGRAGAGDTP